MALYQVQNVSFAYPGQPQKALQNIAFDVERGDFVLFCGPTGSGKTTLLRLLKKEVRPEGEQSGAVRYEGKALDEAGQRKVSGEIAMVFQDPDDQIVMETAWQELVFAMENLGYEPAVIQRRLAEVVSYFGMESWLSSPVHQLSGGQKQLLNLASVMMLRPRVLLLDEPTAQLDPVAAKDFLQTVYRIHQELSTTVVVCEHRLEEVFPLATRLVMLDGGRVKYQGPPAQVIRRVWAQNDRRFREYLPSVSRLFLSANGCSSTAAGREESAVPMTVREARAWAENNGLKLTFNGEDAEKAEAPPRGPELVRCRDVYVQYEKDLPMVLKGLSFSVQRGDFYALLGGNGSGKTTLLKTVAGILRPQRGKVLLEGKNLFKIKREERSSRIGYLAQNPALYFNRDTVEAQLQERAEQLGLAKNSGQLEKVIALFQLKEFLRQHPYDISGGQQQKAALALVLLSGPDLILLDEPTKGLDPLWKLHFAELLEALRREGSTILMVSHDIEFAARFAGRCALLFDGQVVASDPPRSFFSQNYFYTTVMQRTLGEKLPRVLSVEDVSIH